MYMMEEFMKVSENITEVAKKMTIFDVLNAKVAWDTVPEAAIY